MLPAFMKPLPNTGIELGRGLLAITSSRLSRCLRARHLVANGRKHIVEFLEIGLASQRSMAGNDLRRSLRPRPAPSLRRESCRRWSRPMLSSITGIDPIEPDVANVQHVCVDEVNRDVAVGVGGGEVSEIESVAITPDSERIVHARAPAAPPEARQARGR